MSSSKAFLRFALVAGAALWLACDEDTRDPLPDWRDGYERADGGAYASNDAVDSTDGTVPPNTFAITIGAEVTWPMRIGRRDTPKTPCTIAYDPKIGFTPGKKLECIIDQEELDLWVLGLQYDVIVPKGMCAMILLVPYVFENFERCAGPAEVSYTVQPSGAITDEVGSEGGEPVCPCDYSRHSDFAPNCCTGQYKLTVTDAETGKTSVARRSWADATKPGACYYGAGYVEDEARFSTADLPVPYFVHLDRKAHVEHLVFDGVSDKYPATVALANYWDPKDHDGGMPGPLRGEYASPYYEVYCLDDAEEIIAHVQLVVREWNEELEYGGMRDPDTTGTEPGWDLPLDEIDDLFDWKRLSPGADSFPAILPAGH